MKKLTFETFYNLINANFEMHSFLVNKGAAEIECRPGRVKIIHLAENWIDVLTKDNTGDISLDSNGIIFVDCGCDDVGTITIEMINRVKFEVPELSPKEKLIKRLNYAIEHNERILINFNRVGNWHETEQLLIWDKDNHIDFNNVKVIKYDIYPTINCIRVMTTAGIGMIYISFFKLTAVDVDFEY